MFFETKVPGVLFVLVLDCCGRCFVEFEGTLVLSGSRPVLVVNITIY